MRMLIRCSENERASILAAAKRAGYAASVLRFSETLVYASHMQSLDIMLDGFENFAEISVFAELLNVRQRRRVLALFESPLN